MSEFHFDDDLPGREINHGDTRQRMIAFRYASRCNRIAYVFEASPTLGLYADFKGCDLNLSLKAIIAKAPNAPSHRSRALTVMDSLI